MADQIRFREAVGDDLPHIVRMLSDDALGATRERYEDPLPKAYHDAFRAISEDPNNLLIIAEMEGSVAGVLQLTLLPNLSYQGRWRAHIEGVRVDSSRRGSGVGRALFEEAIRRARSAGCHMVQLTSNKTRKDAIRFYESLGFEASHEGMKLSL